MILRHLTPTEAADDLAGRLRAPLLEILEREEYDEAWTNDKVRDGTIEVREIEAPGARGVLLTLVDEGRRPRVLYVFGLHMIGSTRWRLLASSALATLARQKGCGAVRALTTRKGWERLAERHGWQPRETVEYELRVS